MRRLRSKGLPVVLLAIGVIAQCASGQGYAADFTSSDVQLRQKIAKVLDHEGYLGQFTNGQDLARGISAYLWDNRQRLTTVAFPNARKLDVLVCVMVRKGYPEFGDYAANPSFMHWCQGMFK